MAILLTSFLPLLVVVGCLFAYELATHRDRVQRDLHAAADFLAANSAPTLAFDDAEAAQETLATMTAWPDLAESALYTPDGRLFASQVRTGGWKLAPTSAPVIEGLRPGDAGTEMVRSVTQKGRRLGTLYVRAGTARLHERLMRYTSIVLVVSAALAGGAFMLMALLQRLVSSPILRLSRMAEAIARGDLSARAPVTSGDEIGQLAGALNRMANELSQSYAALEARVRARTAELAAANTGLQAEIQERQAAEVALKRTAAELARSNRDLEEFANVASHDLQEPLRKITSFGDLLKSQAGPTLGVEARDYLERMLNAAIRMRRLIDDLLIYSRVSARSQPHVSVDLSRVVQGVLEDLETALARTQGRVEVGPLPVLEAEETQMRQLFQNLISNALKFRKADVAPVVTVRQEADDAVDVPGGGEEAPGGGWCKLVVQDNGIGFDEKYRERIFGVFQRLHTQAAYEGSGIGLAVCRKIVQRHGGVIEAHGRVGEGATFIVRLPLRRRLQQKGEHGDE
ncbi:MAG: HAMP domain-containing protein [Lentisphaerae bacterium]|nr:HAMP domain-containing protein [Lentisphaerota bacterium]